MISDADLAASQIRDKSVLALDVRRPEEYAAGHLPSALNLPLAGLLSDDSPRSVASLAGSLGIGDETRVVVYDDTFGALASRVAWSLEHIGHRDVSLLETTYSGWKAMGLETDSARPDCARRPHSVSENGKILAGADSLESERDSGAVLIDNRERLNYLEQHIPGALSLPYRTLSSPGRILRRPAEMRRLLENRGIVPGSRAITYCGSVGTLSGLAYYALRSAGLGDVRLYVRSFREWKEQKRPVEKQPDANYWDLSAE